MKLTNINEINSLKEDNGINIEIEIYKPIDKENEPNKFGIYISSKGSCSTAKREYITTTEEIGACVKDFVETYL